MCTLSPMIYRSMGTLCSTMLLSLLRGCPRVSRVSRRGRVPTDFVSTVRRRSWYGWASAVVCITAAVPEWGCRTSTFDPMTVRDLGVIIDSGMRLAMHVSYISGVRFFQQLRIVRRSLTAHALVCALVHMRFDYLTGFSFLVCVIGLTIYRQFSARPRQTGTAATVPIICVESRASAVAMVGCGGLSELIDRPPCLQMSPWSSSGHFNKRRSTMCNVE